jgi:spermidine synthase
VEQDGSAGTPITRLTGDPRALTYLFDDVTAVAYAVRRPRTVAVLGAGGGRDVLTALAAGAEQVTAIELHPELVALVRGPYGDYAGHLYDRPDVTVLTGDGRQALATRPARFDLVELSLIDSWAATAAGAYTLAENHLYTLEAFRLYWSRLTPTGLLSASRWMRGGFGVELPRLVLLARPRSSRRASPTRRRTSPSCRGLQWAPCWSPRAPFTAAEQAALRAESERRGFVVHLPWPRGTSPPG